MSISKSITSQVTYSFPPSPDEDKNHQKSGRNSACSNLRQYTSILIISVAAFVLSFQDSVHLITLWPYLQSIDPSATLQFFVLYHVAATSATVLASLVFGKWTNVINQVKLPVMVGFAIGSVGYATMGLAAGVSPTGKFPIGPKWILLCGKIMTGLGMGVMGNLQAYLSMGSASMGERNTFFGFQSGLMTIATVLACLLNMATTPIGLESVLANSHVPINMYTIPAFFNAVMGMIMGLAILVYFHETWKSVYGVGGDDNNREQIEAIYKSNDAANIDQPLDSEPDSDLIKKVDIDVATLKNFDKTAVTICLLDDFIMWSCILMVRALFTPFTMNMMALGPEEAVFWTSLLMGICFVEETFFNFAVPFLLKIVKDRFLIVFGSLMISSFFFIAFPYPGQAKLVRYGPLEGGGQPANLNYSTTIGQYLLPNNISLLATNQPITESSVISFTNHTEPFIEYCSYDWCENMTTVTPAQFASGVLIGLAIGSPLNLCTRPLLLTKIMGPRKLGSIMGLHNGIAQLAGAIGPLVGGFLFESFGPRPTWLLSGLAGLSITVLKLIYYRRLVPWTM